MDGAGAEVAGVAAVGVVFMASSESTAGVRGVVVVVVVVVVLAADFFDTKRPPRPLALPFTRELLGRTRPCWSLVGALVGGVMIEAFVEVTEVGVDETGNLSEVSAAREGFGLSVLSS